MINIIVMQIEYMQPKFITANYFISNINNKLVSKVRLKCGWYLLLGRKELELPSHKTSLNEYSSGHSA